MSTDPGTMSARERAAHVRRTLIDIAKRRQKPGTGSAPFERGQAPMMQWPDLTGVLTGVRWAIAGAVATRQYMPERATRDLDVVVAANDATTAREKMAAAGFRRRADPAGDRSTWHACDGLPVHLIELAEPWADDALTAAAANRDASGAPVLALPHLLLMKMLSARTLDTGDVTRMLGNATDDELARTRALIHEHEPDWSDDLESLIALGKLETAE